MEVICLEDRAFEALVERLTSEFRAKEIQSDSKWIKLEQLMSLLGVKSKTTIQKLRDEGKIKYAQINKKTILYDRFSVDDFLEANSHQTF
jgi:hypothetical protein